MKTQKKYLKDKWISEKDKRIYSKRRLDSYLNYDIYTYPSDNDEVIYVKIK